MRAVLQGRRPTDTDLDALIEGGRKKWKKPDEEQAAPGTGPGPDADHANNYDAEFKAEPKIEPEPLQWLDMSNWDNVTVPERGSGDQGSRALHQVGLFSGEGGTGKSIVELMKNVAHVAAKDWFGSLPEQGPAFYLGAEDDEDEIHIRLAVIAKHYGITFAELVQDGLHVLPLLGKDAVLCAASGKGGRVEPTALYHQIFEAAGDLKGVRRLERIFHQAIHRNVFVQQRRKFRTFPARFPDYRCKSRNRRSFVRTS